MPNLRTSKNLVHMLRCRKTSYQTQGTSSCPSNKNWRQNAQKRLIKHNDWFTRCFILVCFNFLWFNYAIRFTLTLHSHNSLLDLKSTTYTSSKKLRALAPTIYGTLIIIHSMFQLYNLNKINYTREYYKILYYNFIII